MIYPPPRFCHLHYAKSASRGQLYLVFAHSGKTKTPTVAAEFPSSCSFCAILPHKAPTTRPPPDSSCRLVGRRHTIEGRKTLRPRRENTGGNDRSALANFGHLGRQVVAKLVLLLEQTEQVLVKERRRRPLLLRMGRNGREIRRRHGGGRSGRGRCGRHKMPHEPTAQLTEKMRHSVKI